MNRAIRARDLDAIFITGPGHGGPGLVANTYLEGTYTEVYPQIGHDEEGLRRLFRQFSFPGGIPSHVAPETPGSINEGGELGYSLRARLRRRVRQPGPARRLRRRRRRGRDRTARGELAFEQVPQPGPRRRRAADPAPQRLQDRQPDGARTDPGGRAASAVRGIRLRAAVRDGIRPGADARADGGDARRGARRDRARSRRGSGRGLEGRAGAAGVADDRAPHAEGLDRAEGRSTGCRPRAASARIRCRSPTSARTPSTSPQLEAWLRSYRPEELFDAGRCASSAELAALAPTGERRMGANPHANGGLLLRALELPDFRNYAVDVPAPGTPHERGDEGARRSGCAMSFA